MQHDDEKKNSGHKSYSLDDLKFVSATGAHAYTTLSCPQIEEKALKDYALKYKYIEKMDLSRNALQTVRVLSQFKHLRWLDVSYNQLKEFDLAVEWNIDQNTGNKSLFALNVSHNTIINLGCVSQHINVEVLDLSHNNLQSVEELRSLRLLRKLDISYNTITDLSPIHKLPIIELNASNNNIYKMNDICASAIKICNVNHNHISDLDCVRQFHHLTELHMIQNDISDFDAFANLKQLSLLRALDIRGNPIVTKQKNDTDLRYEMLWIVPGLERFNDERIEAQEKIESQCKHNAFDEKLRSISSYYAEKSRTYDVDENSNTFWYRLVEEGFAVDWEQFMTKFPHLSTTTIDLSDVCIGNAGLHSVCECISESPNVKQLILRNSLSVDGEGLRWSDTKYKWGLQYLCESLLVHNTLCYLDLSGCGIDGIKFEAVADIIEQCLCLDTLNLNDNNIGQHTVAPCPAVQLLTQSIAQSESKSLKKLSISRNNIDGSGAYYIGKLLQSKDCSLEKLDISHNPIGAEGNGFAEVTKAIALNHALKCLNISHCIQDEYGSQFMESSLKQNTALIELGIDVQSTDYLHKILSSFSNHSDLKCFYLSNTQQQPIALNTSSFEWCSALHTLHLDKLCLLSTNINQILTALCQNNECLTDLNLCKADLDAHGWRLLTKLCNKLKLKQLDISECSVHDHEECAAFLSSYSIQNTLNHLNMANMNWNCNVKPIFEELRSLDLSPNSNRIFTLNLSRFPLLEDGDGTRMDLIDCVLSVWSKTGVTRLILDYFMATDRSKVMNTILDWFAQRNHNRISSLSVMHTSIDFNCEEVLPSIQLEHIVLPLMNSNDTLKNVVRHVMSNPNLKSVELENAMDEDMMDLILSLSHKVRKMPRIVSNKFIDVHSKSMDLKINKYCSNIA